MSSQYDAAHALAGIFGDHPELDGNVFATVYGTGTLSITAFHSVDVSERDNAFAQLCDIIGARPKTTLQRAPGRCAWRDARGVYRGVHVDVTAHYTDAEAELLHVAAERPCDAAPSAHFSMNQDGVIHQNVDLCRHPSSQTSHQAWEITERYLR